MEKASERIDIVTGYKVQDYSIYQLTDWPIDRLRCKMKVQYRVLGI